MKRSKRNQVAPEEDQQTKWVTTRSDVKLRVQYLTPSGDDPDPTDARTKAIIFIHGVGGSSDVWNSQLKYFSERGYYAIAPDLLGHGFSSAPDKPGYYTFESMRIDCIKVFDQTCKDVNVVVGHSYGTSFAAYLASARRDRISKLVLMSGGAPVALGPQVGVFSLPSFLLTCLRPAMSRMFYKNGFHKKNQTLPDKERAFDIPSNILRHTMRGQKWEDGDVEFHSKLQQPTLLLHGIEDKLEGRDATFEMHQTLQLSDIYFIADAGHMVMMEQPTIVNKLIDKFLMSTLTKDASERGVPSPPARRLSRPSSSHLTKSQPNLRKSTLTGG